MNTLRQCALACFWGLRYAYLRALHKRIMQSDPSHPEAVRTMLEIRRAQARLDAVWEAA